MKFFLLNIISHTDLLTVKDGTYGNNMVLFSSCYAQTKKMQLTDVNDCGV